jgi:tRNA(Ile)-lysidine synthase
MREGEEALTWAAEQLGEDRVTSAGGEWRIEVSGLPREFKRRLLTRTIAEIRAEAGLDRGPTRGEDIDNLVNTLSAGGTATLAGIIARGGACWLLRLAPPRRPTRG